jgi:hypothetical protein
MDAGLFIDAEHQRALWRVQIEADDVQQFGLEIGIGTEGEGANPMGWPTEYKPGRSDWADTVGAEVRELASGAIFLQSRL